VKTDSLSKTQMIVMTQSSRKRSHLREIYLKSKKTTIFMKTQFKS